MLNLNILCYLSGEECAIAPLPRMGGGMPVKALDNPSWKVTIARVGSGVDVRRKTRDKFVLRLTISGQAGAGTAPWLASHAPGKESCAP